MTDIPVPLDRQDGVNARLKHRLKYGDEGSEFDFNPFKREKSQDGIGDLIKKTPTLPPPTMAEATKKLSDIVKEAKKATASLSIVSSDHQIEDSPNASHVNEHIGRSNAMMAVKTIGKRKNIIDSKSRPLAKRVRRRYVFENNSEDDVVDSSDKTKSSTNDSKKTSVEKREIL